MATDYSEHPHNWNELEPYVNKGSFTTDLFTKKTCFFYDACSFRYHANMCGNASANILGFIKDHDGIIVISRCILMELASLSGVINQEYIRYIKDIDVYGLPVYVIYEEDLLDVLSFCYSTNSKVNSLLMWAVRTIKGPVSTITTVLAENEKLGNMILKGKNLDNKACFKQFFSAVRGQKESGDNLGEELLGICLHMLSQLTGEEDGKFCLLTDDKGAAGKIDRLFQSTPAHYRGKRIILYSTPKLAQILYTEGYIGDVGSLSALLPDRAGGNIKVLGTQVYDLKSTEISLTKEELAEQIISNTIHITF